MSKLELKKVKENSPKINNAEEEEKLFDISSGLEIKTHKNRVFIWTIYIIWIIATIILLIRVVHFISPTNWQWLDANQVQTLDKFLFSGTIGAMVGKYGSKVFD